MRYKVGLPSQLCTTLNTIWFPEFYRIDDGMSVTFWSAGVRNRAIKLKFWTINGQTVNQNVHNLHFTKMQRWKVNNMYSLRNFNQKHNKIYWTSIRQSLLNKENDLEQTNLSHVSKSQQMDFLKMDKT